MNKAFRQLIDVVWYLVVFILLQYFTLLVVGGIVLSGGGMAFGQVLHRLYTGNIPLEGSTMAIASAVSGILTIILFAWKRWAPVSRSYIGSRPWVALVWVALLALGTILPSEWLIETLHVEMPDSYGEMFSAIMSTPLGYLALGIVATFVEEMVFRGAILRKLLELLGEKNAWIAIVVSALLFGMIHLNKVQFIHASLIGLLLGWMYHRSGSIVPGVVFHWVNNTVAYLMFHLMPQMQDGKLIDLFHGSQTTMMLGLLFSLCILVPALFQLWLRLKKA